MSAIARLRDKANSLPTVPGVYIMKDKSGQVIYVGKSKKLKNRVSSYFQDSRNHAPKTLAMRERARDLEYILVIVSMAWQFLSPVMYSMGQVPEDVMFVFEINPMTSIMTAYRDIFMPIIPRLIRPRPPKSSHPFTLERGGQYANQYFGIFGGNRTSLTK